MRIPVGRSAHRRAFRTIIAVVGAAALALLGLQPQAHATPQTTPKAAPEKGSTAARQTFAQEPLCGAPAPGHLSCFALRAPSKTVHGTARTQDVAGLSPADLRSAYNLPSDGGAGQTIAIVDAFDSPAAEEDLAVYRSQYGLPPCTSANGCFAKVDQRGGTNYPAPDQGWAGEIALDLDMVSAAAPRARILLVEADDTSTENLGKSVDEAVNLGAGFVSNSYGTRYDLFPESPEETSWEAHYDHPGVAIVASSGDFAYGVAFPADSPHVTAVGGTSLVRDPSSPRGWTESVWFGAGHGGGSGCSLYLTKPAFQSDSGCLMRSVADVSAVADPATGVAVYDSYGSGGWTVLGGTSASSPLITGIYADAGTPAPDSYPNTYPYTSAASDSLNDVTSGHNAETCEPSYLCTAGIGYDGPTGLGTPHGTGAFHIRAYGSVSGTVTKKGAKSPIAGASVTVGVSQTTTDERGHYRLSVPEGTYKIKADAFGYALATSSSVTIDDNGTAGKDFALNPVPSQTITGKVTDGSGHGWPLHAQISVPGTPAATAWTDPFTGAYRLALPTGHTYVLRVSTDVDGYQTVTRKLAVGNHPLDADTSLPVDAQTPEAPGYTVHLHGTAERFDSTTSAPPGWTVTNAEGTEGGWTFDDPGGRGNQTGGTGAFAVVDSDYYGADAHQDSILTGPVYDLSNAATPVLDFSTDYHGYEGQAAIVEASSDAGSHWTELRHVENDAIGPVHSQVSLASFSGKSAVQVRFRFVGSWGYWWALDDVTVGDRTYDSDPGGLVGGFTRDSNTSSGLNKVAVTDSMAGSRAMSAATSDAVHAGDGYYWMFVPPGRQTLTASKDPYAAASTIVRAKANTMTRADVPLTAGRISVDRASVSGTVLAGGKTTEKLTVRNTGSSKATVTITDQLSVPGEPATPGAPADAWKAQPDLPIALIDNAVDSYQGTLYNSYGTGEDIRSDRLYVLEPGATAWSQRASASDQRGAVAHGFIGGKLYATGGWLEDGTSDPKLEVYDPKTDSWTAKAPDPRPRGAAGSAVVGDDLYVIGGCESFCAAHVSSNVDVYHAATNTWARVADYPLPIDFVRCGTIGGRVYCAGGSSDSSDAVGDAYVYTPSTNSWAHVADMPQAVWGAASAVANGRLLITGGRTAGEVAPTARTYAFDPDMNAWTRLPDALIPQCRGAAGAGFTVVGGSTYGGASEAVPSAQNLAGWDQTEQPDVSWLQHGHRITLRPHESAALTVTMNSAADGADSPATYVAELVLRTDTPYGGASVMVRMRVR
ncbi:carboxypeptidase regulatory-like domain-containing protein [Streptomyces sp. NPDC090080]|uniref:carboxypeptidase regulatory-like domain-containing protein n=1 Tax=Streptomyces sp. NPDC090080 TaxID=3365939 RepID=UPI003823D4BF